MYTYGIHAMTTQSDEPSKRAFTNLQASPFCVVASARHNVSVVRNEISQ